LTFSRNAGSSIKYKNFGVEGSGDPGEYQMCCVKNLRRISAIVLLLMLAACGGGGGGGASTGSLTLSTSALVFSTNNLTFTPAPQFVTATVSTKSQSVYMRIVVTGQAVANVTNIAVTGATSGQASVIPANAQVLGPGTFTSTITVTACTTSLACTSGLIGTPQSINVTYTIDAIDSTSSGVSYTLGTAATAADYSRPIIVTSSSGFTATSSVPWLTLTPASSSTAGSAQLTAALVQPMVDTFDSGTRTAQITLTNSTGNQLVLPVALTIAKPQLDQVTPHVAVAGAAGTVILRGKYLDLLPTIAAAIEFATTVGGAGVPANSVTLVSPTELRVTHPALAAGPWLVQMRSSSGTLIDRSRARLYAATPPAYPAGVISYPVASGKYVNAFAYDAERKALLVGVVYTGLNNGYGSNELYRIGYNVGWVDKIHVNVPNLDALTLTADGRQLLVASETGGNVLPTIERRDPTSLAATASSTTVPNAFNQGFMSLAVTSNGDVLALADSHPNCCGYPLYRYVPSDATLSQIPSTSFSRGIVAASADGSTAMVGDTSVGGGLNIIYNFNASTGSLSQWGSNAQRFEVRQLQLSRDGAHALFNTTELYDRLTFTLRGRLPVSSRASVLNAAGTVAYTYGADGKLHKYDVSAFIAGGTYTESGTGVTLAGNPSAVPGEVGVKMLLSPDGGTLFLAGTQQIVVVPAP
jgi:hypothetical protein